MLTQYDVQYRFRKPDESGVPYLWWTNTYYYDVEPSNQNSFAATLAIAIRPYVQRDVEFFKVGVRTVPNPSGPTSYNGVGFNGLRTPTQDSYNLNAVALFRGYAADGTRRFIYFRGPLQDRDYSGPFLTTGFIDIMSAMASDLMDLGGMCAWKGSPLVSLYVDPKLYAHQMRRGTRRTHVPIIG